jgi:hypothetical protein
VQRGFIVVEGVGEYKAAGNLINRLWSDLGLSGLVWTAPRRWLKLHQQSEIERACNWARLQPNAGGLLILRDEDDKCPKNTGPEIARWIRGCSLPFPAASVLFHREYEVLFLASLASIAGEDLIDDRGVARPGVRANARFEGDLESVRGVKEWLSKRFPPGRSYKPSLDQLPMTRSIDFGLVRSSGLPCFGTLERSLRFLSEHRSFSAVYPPPAALER